MPFVPAQCPNCGGALKVDNTKEAYICEHCGTPFITEKAINNYSTNVANNTYISNATFVQENEIKKLFDAAKGYIKLDQISEAEEVYSKITQEYPQLFEGWYAIIELYIEQLKKAEHLYIETPFENRPLYQPDEAYKNARKLATPEQNRMIDSLLEEYTELYNADRKKARKNIWFHSFVILMEYMKRENIGLIEPKYDRGYSAHSDTARIVLERESLKLEIDIIRNPETYDTYLHDIYVYTITGYDPNTYSFTFAEQGECYSQHIGEYKNGSSKYEYRRSTIECDVKLFVEDYNSEDLISKYYSYPYSGRPAQFLCKCEHRGKTSTIFWKEESMSNIGVPRYYKNTNSCSGGCYVATCVYGSYDCPEVWTLRRFRDYDLAETWYGRAFIRIYYAISPTIVKWFGNTDWVKNMWKSILDKMVKKLHEKGFESTPYNDL